MENNLKRFRIVALLEGISFILLLGVAMPMKYFANMPLAVKYTGWVHGVLFIFYLLLLMQVKIEHNWNLKKTGLAFIASLLPFGTFVFARKLQKDIASTPSK